MAEKEKLAGHEAPRVTVSTSKIFAAPAGKIASDRVVPAAGAVVTSSGAVGVHLIADFWGARYLTDIVQLEQAICAAVQAANATLLHIHLHRFDDGGGVTGVAMLAESHISVHTWPERSYAAFDIFMCGDSDPRAALAVLRELLGPTHDEVHTIARGCQSRASDDA